MNKPTLQRARWTSPLAALLLVIQGIAGGVVPLAHAAERFSAPAHIEAQHGSDCLVLHDELRCALCRFAATRVTTQRPDARLVATLHAESPSDPYPVAPTPAARHLTAPPRAPPFLS